MSNILSSLENSLNSLKPLKGHLFTISTIAGLSALTAACSPFPGNAQKTPDFPTQPTEINEEESTASKSVNIFVAETKLMPKTVDLAQVDKESKVSLDNQKLVISGSLGQLLSQLSLQLSIDIYINPQTGEIVYRGDGFTGQVRPLLDLFTLKLASNEEITAFLAAQKNESSVATNLPNY